MIKLFLIVAMSLLLSGCGTLAVRAGFPDEPSDMPQYYPATVVDAQLVFSPFYLLIVEPTEIYEDDLTTLPRALLACLVGVVDLPISLVSDTIYLPWDIKNRESNKDLQPTVTTPVESGDVQGTAAEL